MPETKNIFDIDEGDFQEKVIEASSNDLILVDFWAPWCGPCKQLTPLLEKIINSSNKKVKLIKIDIDKNQQIAGQLKIQSIPAVFAFKNGQPVDAFQGVIKEKQIIEFIEKSLGEKIKEDHTEFYKKIENLIEKKEFNQAKTILETFLVENPDEYKSFSLYIDCLTDLKMYDEANQFCNSLSDEAINNLYIKASIQKLNIKQKNKNGPTLDELKNELKKNPKKIKSVIALADKYFSENIIDEAFEILLLNYLSNKEIIKRKLLEFFEALGNENEFTIKYRRKLSSIIFS